MTDIPAENVAYFTADKWGGYWQTVRDGRPYNFRLDLSHCKYVESLEERMARLEEATIERCAKVAEQRYTRETVRKTSSGEPYAAGKMAIFAASTIASAIRAISLEGSEPS